MSRPIVFIHGSGDSARIWRFQVDYLTRRGLEAVAIDLPGHGQRPDIFPVEVTVQDYARAAWEMVKHELHLTQPVIAGHSLGGAVALMMGLEYGDELAGLILVGTGARLRVHPSLLEAAQQRPDEAKVRLTELALAQQNVSSISPKVIEEQTITASTILYRDLSACNVFDVMSRLHEIVLPTLIICGVEDRLTPVKYSDYLHQHIAGSTLRIIRGAGHYVMREQPEEVNQAITEWMATAQLSS